ncbi:MAG TPA: hypothetical protein VFJ58_20665 [Armatimonadota bacterium]|nr:hypothetical protein [Armatimonadota bacterium]
MGMMRRKLASIFWIVASLLVALQSSTIAVHAQTASNAGGTYTVLDPPNSTDSQANGINDYGQIVGGFSVAGRGHGFLFSGGVYTIIDPPNSVHPQISGINDSGQVVGTYGGGAVLSRGFLFSGGAYTTVDPPNSTYTQVSGINGVGQVVGYFTDAAQRKHGFLCSDSAYTTLDYPNSTGTVLGGINDKGQITGGFGSDNGNYGLLYSDGVYTALNVPNTTNSIGVGINASGEVLGWFDAGMGIPHGFLLSGSFYTIINPPGSIYTQVSGINDSGQVAGYSVDFARKTQGFLFSGGVYTILDPPGSKDNEALGLNNEGQIVGFFEDAVGTKHGFMYTPPGAKTYRYPAGISMASVPYDYSSQGTDAAVLFGLRDVTPAPIAIYDPAKTAYDFYPTLLDSGKQTRPGRAYWVMESASQPSPAPGDLVASPFTESLSPGWNMIADPFPTALDASTLQLTAAVPVGNFSAGTSISENDASTAGLIGGPLWTYDTSSKQYQQTTTLQPYSGAWIFIDRTVSGGQPVTLKFTLPGA